MESSDAALLLFQDICSVSLLQGSSGWLLRKFLQILFSFKHGYLRLQEFYSLWFSKSYGLSAAGLIMLGADLQQDFLCCWICSVRYIKKLSGRHLVSVLVIP